MPKYFLVILYFFLGASWAIYYFLKSHIIMFTILLSDELGKCWVLNRDAYGVPKITHLFLKSLAPLNKEKIKKCSRILFFRIGCLSGPWKREWYCKLKKLKKLPIGQPPKQNVWTMTNRNMTPKLQRDATRDTSFNKVLFSVNMFEEM